MSLKRRNLYLTPEEYAKRLWDWTALNEAFTRGIRVGDIDGFVEVNNKFLFIEGKPVNGNLPKGQKLAYERLAKLEQVTVIVVEGNPPFDITGWSVIGKKRYKGTDRDFVQFIKKWFDYVSTSDQPANVRGFMK